MLTETFRVIVSDGRDQQHRRPPALCGTYFQPDEMRFEQLLALATERQRRGQVRQTDIFELSCNIEVPDCRFAGPDPEVADVATTASKAAMCRLRTVPC